MKKNNSKTQENYLDRRPKRREGLEYTESPEGIVTLNRKNEGFVNRLAQKLFKKPPVSYIHLDENGSFIWLRLDGETTVEEIGVAVKEKFKEAAEPLYPRLTKYLSILESYGFIEWAE